MPCTRTRVPLRSTLAGDGWRWAPKGSESDMTIWIVPTVVLLFLLVFVVVLWRWYSRRAKYTELTKEH